MKLEGSDLAAIQSILVSSLPGANGYVPALACETMRPNDS